MGLVLGCSNQSPMTSNSLHDSANQVKISMRWQCLIFLIVLTSSSILADLYDELTENSIIDLVIQRFDKNKDGKITLEDVGEEIKRTHIPVENIFRKLDKDNDNDVDRKDLEIEVEHVADIMVSMGDFNEDGYVTESEYNYAINATAIKNWQLYFMFWFDLVDLNEDGVISDDDFTKLAPFQKIKMISLRNKYDPTSLIYKSVDTNEDYQLSKTEFTQFLTKMLNKIDLNNDGITNLKEILQTMNIYDFPEDIIKSTEVQFQHIYNVSRKNVKATFIEYDTNKDDKMDATELSAIFTTPMSRSFINTVQDIYASIQPSANVKGFKTLDLMASFVAFLNVLETPVPSPVDILIQQLDKNSDEKITWEEAETTLPIDEKVFSHFDINKDYSIDHTDIESLLNQLTAGLIGIYDFKKDGHVTENEAHYSLSVGASTVKGWEGFINVLFDIYDVTEDGIISDIDFPDFSGPMGRRTPSQMLKTFLLRNKNSPNSKLITIVLKAMNMGDENYQLSRTELAQFLRKVMNKLDNNKDGSVTLQEILETIKVFKFPGKVIKRVKQEYQDIFKVGTKIWEVIFNEFDTNGDDKMDKKELSTVFTSPITSSLVIGVQDIYESLPSNPGRDKEISQKEIEATFSSISNFLQF